MKIPQTIEMQVGALNTSEHNPRQITEDDFAELVKSLLLLPKGLYYRPVVVDDRNIALAGNMRLRARNTFTNSDSTTSQTSCGRRTGSGISTRRNNPRC